MSKNENNELNKEVKYDERGREQIKAWYALVVLPGREIKIKEKLEKLSNNPHLKDQIFRVMVPSTKEEKVDSKGKIKIKETLIYTQYVYVEMILNDDTYHAVKIDGVRHILGVPTPVPEEDIKNIYKRKGEKYEVDALETPVEFVVGTMVVLKNSKMEIFKDKEAEIISIDGDNYELSVKFDDNEMTYTAKKEEF